jgi:hypothetical protein
MMALGTRLIPPLKWPPNRRTSQCIVVDMNDSSSLYKRLRKPRIFYLFHPLTLFAFVLYIKIIIIVFPDFMFGINLSLDLRSSKTLGTCTVESVDSAFDEQRMR